MASVSILPFVEDQQVIYRGYIKTNIVDKLNVRRSFGRKEKRPGSTGLSPSEFAKILRDSLNIVKFNMLTREVFWTFWQCKQGKIYE
jgi:hypothetical protein